jgi:hypothetical protein
VDAACGDRPRCLGGGVLELGAGTIGES